MVCFRYIVKNTLHTGDNKDDDDDNNNNNNNNSFNGAFKDLDLLVCSFVLEVVMWELTGFWTSAYCGHVPIYFYSRWFFPTLIISKYSDFLFGQTVYILLIFSKLFIAMLSLRANPLFTVSYQTHKYTVCVCVCVLLCVCVEAMQCSF